MKRPRLHINAPQPLKTSGIALRQPPYPRRTLNPCHASPRPVASEGSLGRRTEAAAGAERTGSVSDRSSFIARAGQGSTQRKAATDQAGGSPRDVSGRSVKWSQAARTRVRPREDMEPQGPRDGAFDPSAREVPVRVAGVTRTVPGLHAGAACPSWAPGVAAKNGACPELMPNSLRGASVFVETVKPYPLLAKARRPAQLSTARASTRRASLFLLPLREKVATEGQRMRGLATPDVRPQVERCAPLIRPRAARPPPPARGEGTGVARRLPRPVVAHATLTVSNRFHPGKMEVKALPWRPRAPSLRFPVP